MGRNNVTISSYRFTIIGGKNTSFWMHREIYYEQN
jgi:hypothetical protein